MERKELEEIEEAILEAEKETMEVEAIFADPELHSKHGSKTNELTNKLKKAKKNTLELYSRWEELELIKQASEAK